MNILLLIILLLFSCSKSFGYNVVVIMTDDQNYDQLQHMPYLSTAPFGNWVQFSNANDLVALCCPSMVTFVKGNYSWLEGVTKNEEGEKMSDAVSIGTKMQAGGFATGYFGKYLTYYPWVGEIDPDTGQPYTSTYVPAGWDDWRVLTYPLNSGYLNYTLNENGSLVPYANTESNYSTDVITNHSLNFIDAHHDEPFFLVTRYYAPHAPYTPAKRHKTTPVTFPPLPPNWNEADVSDKPAWIRNRSLYDPSKAANHQYEIEKAVRAILPVDEGVKQILDRLNSYGILDNTVVMFFSDNGYLYGSHRWHGKDTHYEEAGHIPLMIRYPNITSRTENKIVTNLDFHRSILDFAEQPLSGEGESLEPLILNSNVTWRDAVLLACRHSTSPTRRYYGIKTADGWKYIEYERPTNNPDIELYDLINDPYELESQHDNPAFDAIKADLIFRLEELKP